MIVYLLSFLLLLYQIHDLFKIFCSIFLDHYIPYNYDLDMIYNQKELTLEAMKDKTAIELDEMIRK
jgi:hypothetical protein